MPELCIQVDFLELTDAGVEKFSDRLLTSRGDDEYLDVRLRFEATVDGDHRYVEERWVNAFASRKVALGIADAYPRPESPEPEEEAAEVEAVAAKAVIPNDPRAKFAWKARFRGEVSYRLQFAVSREAGKPDVRTYARVEADIGVREDMTAHHSLACDDFTLYVTVCPRHPDEIRHTPQVVAPSRQYLDSSRYTALVRQPPPLLRVVLYAPRQIELYRDAPTPQNRFENLNAMLGAAREQIAGALSAGEQQARMRGHDILYVFMAPEWYFRRRERPLTEAEFVNAVEAVRALSREAQWRAWLIVPGSVYWARPAEPVSRLGVEQMQKVAGPQAAGPAEFQRWHVFNTSVAFNNGQFVNMCTKAYEADIPHARRDAWSWGMDDKDLHKQAPLDAHGLCAFNFGGVHFGLEICLDHQYGRLLREVAGEGVDVHLFMASDGKIKIECVGARDNGFLFYVDSGPGALAAWKCRAGVSKEERSKLFRRAVHGNEAGLDIQKKIEECDRRVRGGDRRARAEREKLYAELEASEGALGELAAEVAGVVQTTQLEPVYHDAARRLAIYDLLKLEPAGRR